MFRKLRLGPLQDPNASQLVPPIVQPLLAAARRGEDVAPLALALIRSFGFDGFWFLYSTWPDELTRIYDERAFIEIDPRIDDMVKSVVPVVWD